jgi:hypothetical protein
LAGEGLSTYVYTNSNPLRGVDPWGLAPGDPFPTRDAAAVDALNYINPTSIAQNTEYAGIVYQDPASGNYYAYPPVATGEYGGNALHLKFPRGMRLVGDYHTHADYCDGTGKRTDRWHDMTDANHFSRPDKDFARSIVNTYPDWMRYLGTPSGMYYSFSPTAGLTVLNPK